MPRGLPGGDAAERPAQHQVTGQEDVGVAQRPQRDEVGGPRPDPRAAPASRPAVRSTPRRQGRIDPESPRLAACRRRRRAATAHDRAGPGAGDADRALEVLRVEGREHLGAGNARSSSSRVPRWSAGQPSGHPTRGSPWAATRRAANTRPAASDTCWPSTTSTAVSNASVLPGTRRCGRARTSGPSTGSSASAATPAAGSASSPTHRRPAAAAAARHPASRRRRRRACRRRPAGSVTASTT